MRTEKKFAAGIRCEFVRELFHTTKGYGSMVFVEHAMKSVRESSGECSQEVELRAVLCLRGRETEGIMIVLCG